MRISFILSLVFAIIVAIFGIQNSAVISINFFFTKINISLALLIFISAIVGAIIVTLLGLKKEFTLSRGNKKLTKQAEILQSENVDLKNENEILKSKINDFETKNKTSSDKIDSLNIEIEPLNTIPTTEINQ